MVARLGNYTIERVRGLGDFALFIASSLGAVFATRRLPGRVARAVYEQGFRCLPVILIVGTFTGLVLGLQGYYVLIASDPRDCSVHSFRSVLCGKWRQCSPH